jgi:adenylate cyclase
LGRLPACDIPIRYTTVSSRHCELILRDGFWFVRDLGSSNGTRVNGAVCTWGWIMPQDILTLATYRYLMDYSAPPDQPPPRALKEQPQPAARPTVAKMLTPARPVVRTDQVPASEFQGELIPCGGGNPIPLHKPQIVIGRDPSCDVVLRVPTVSGRHCQLDWRNGFWHVQDLGSHNGIRVDGGRCQSKQLKPGSTLSVAFVRFRIVFNAPFLSSEDEVNIFSRSLLERAGLTGAEDLSEEATD